MKVGGMDIQALIGHVRAQFLARFLALRALLKAGDWRIVHSHTLFSSGLHLTAARLAGVEHRVAHSHNTQDANSASLAGRCYQWVARKLIEQMSTRRVACGDTAAEYLFPGRKDVVVIPNAVDIGKFATATGSAVRAELGIEEGQLVVIQIGRFMPVKNHSRSVEIALALEEAGVDFQLLFVGAGPEQDRIGALIRERGLEGRVRVLGLRTDIAELMAAADVMLMPSFHEGFPVVLVEAQAAGLRSVVSAAVSPEVELGMDMVDFIDLENSDAIWADALQAGGRKGAPDQKTRTATLEQKGFSAAAGARRLERVYSAA